MPQADDSEFNFPSTITLPILWGNMDAFNHVNNTIHIRWFESSRIRYLEQSGTGELLQNYQLGPILASVQCSYKRQLRYPANVTIGSRVSRLGGSSMTVMHGIRNEQTQEIAALGESVVVVFDFEKQKPKRIPQDIRDAILEFQNGVLE